MSIREVPRHSVFGVNRQEIPPVSVPKYPEPIVRAWQGLMARARDKARRSAGWCGRWLRRSPAWAPGGTALTLVGLLMPLGAMPASASLMASNYVRMDVIDDWWVWKAADGMCGTEHADTLGTTFSVAIFSRAPDQIVFAVSNTSWGSIKIGQHYPFILSVNGVARRLDGIAINGAASANDPTLAARTDLKSGLDSLSRLRPFSVAMGETPLVHDVRVPPRAVTWLIGCAAGSGDPFRAGQ